MEKVKTLWLKTKANVKAAATTAWEKTKQIWQSKAMSKVVGVAFDAAQIVTVSWLVWTHPVTMMIVGASVVACLVMYVVACQVLVLVILTEAVNQMNQQ